MRQRYKSRRVVAALLALPLLVTACGGKSASKVAAESAVVERVAGTDVYRITLSAEAAKRLEVRTAAVVQMGNETVIPYSAVLYSATGEAWAYVSSKPLTFVREAIVVDRIDGDRAILSSGPNPGTQVATVGVSELHGIESGAGGKPAATGATGNGSRPTPIGSEVFDPANFDHSATVDNKWLPLKPGMQFVFTGSSSDGEKRLVFIVTDLVKVVDGVRSVVIWDRDYTDGELVEAELAFFAQDNAGNVWHTGEYPEEYEGGKVVASPAWLAGVKGATAGFEMKAQPRSGTPAYAQGYAPPPVNWTDHAQVYKLGQKTCVPFQCYRAVLITREFNLGERGSSQLKYYAPGVGNIRVGWLGSKDKDREVLALVDLVHLSPAALAKVRAAALKLERRAYKTKPDVYGRTPPAERLP